MMDVEIAHDPSQLRVQARSHAAELDLPEPVYDQQVVWADSYEELFSRSSDDLAPWEALVPRAFEAGCVVLAAEGGTGKSVLLRRLFAQAATEPGDVIVPLLVDVADWSDSVESEWESLEGNDLGRADLLVRRLARPRTTLGVLAALPHGQRPVFLIDGLSEIALDRAADLLSALDELLRFAPRSGALVTDRLVRRSLPSRGWQLATLAPLPSPHVLERIALFRSLAETQQLSGTTSFASQWNYFATWFTKEDIRSIAKAALDAYRREQSRTFKLGRFQQLAGHSAVKKLIEEGHVIVEEGRAKFWHHLFHDFFASIAVAQHPSSWRQHTFDAVTLEAGSFDVLGLTLQQLETSEKGDLLLSRIYDWNYYGAAYALAKAMETGLSPASSEMETALLAMLGERQWDPIRATIEQVKDALRLFPSPSADRVLAARGLEDIFGLVRERVPTSSPLGDWRDVFLTPPQSKLDDVVVHRIEDGDSLIGWTLANVLKRCAATDAQQQWLRTRLSSSRDTTVQWRIVHALGSHPNQSNMRAVLAALDSGTGWVQYGAVRSLVEMASAKPALGKVIFQRLIERAELIETQPKVRQQFARAVLVRKPPKGWSAVVAPVIEYLWEGAETREEQQRWGNLARQVEALT